MKTLITASTDRGQDLSRQSLTKKLGTSRSKFLKHSKHFASIFFSDTELLDDSYSLYGVKLASGGSRGGPRSPFPPPAAVPYDATRYARR